MLQVTDAVDKLGEQAARVQEAIIQRKALEDTQQLLSSIDVGKYVVEGAPLTDCLKEGNGDLQGRKGPENADKQSQRHATDLDREAQALRTRALRTRAQVTQPSKQSLSEV